jgi:hypothetical protein
MIGGFIVTGHWPKKVILRALGPSLARSGISDCLADPELELHDASGATVATNHDWKIADDGNSAKVAEIAASGIAPSDDRESAIVATLQPNQNFTAILRGENSTTGVALVEAYDLDPSADALLANISTRGFVGSNNEVMIGGFILGGGNGATRVVLRAIGPSLRGAGIDNTLHDPTLELHDANGNGFAANDNWKDAQQSEIEATGLAPANEFESTLLLTLPPGNYTAVVAGKNGDTGVGLMEVYNLE